MPRARGATAHPDRAAAVTGYTDGMTELGSSASSIRDRPKPRTAIDRPPRRATKPHGAIAHLALGRTETETTREV
eukprot:1454331-Alexandrium_andersonii.AAC.1